MRNNDCITQRISKFTLGMILLGAAMGLVVIGMTLLPIIGFVAAIPVTVLAFYFFRVDLNDQCQIDFPAD